MEENEYLQDLLNCWSPYYSPVVCVRKKYGSLRLCCDYCELKKFCTWQAPHSQHPTYVRVPEWQFLVFDREPGQGLQQGFFDAESQPLTAFITIWLSIYYWLSDDFLLLTFYILLYLFDLYTDYIWTVCWNTGLQDKDSKHKVWL